MPNEVKHTPLPWKAVHWVGGSEVINNDGEQVVRTSGGYRAPVTQARIQEDVELIVRAVNAHAELLAACELALDELVSWQGDPEDLHPSNTAQRALRAVIAKAKGGA